MFTFSGLLYAYGESLNTARRQTMLIAREKRDIKSTRIREAFA
jgi:hypothetical protein